MPEDSISGDDGNVPVCNMSCQQTRYLLYVSSLKAGQAGPRACLVGVVVAARESGKSVGQSCDVGDRGAA